MDIIIHYVIYTIVCHCTSFSTSSVHHLYIIDKYEYTVNVKMFALYIFSRHLRFSKSANYVQRENNNLEGII